MRFQKGEMTIMSQFKFNIFIRALKAAAVAASNDSATPRYLCGVNVEFLSDGIVYTATDSHRAIMFRHDYLDGDTAPVNKFSVTVPFEMIDAIKPNSSRFEAIMEVDLVKEGPDKIRIRYAPAPYTFESDAIEGPYPDLTLACPKEPVSGEAGQYNPNFLKSFSDARSILLDIKNKKGLLTPVAVHNNGMRDPALIDFRLPQDFNISGFGILMPLIGLYSHGPQTNISDGCTPKWFLNKK